MLLKYQVLEGTLQTCTSLSSGSLFNQQGIKGLATWCREEGTLQLHRRLPSVVQRCQALGHNMASVRGPRELCRCRVLLQAKTPDPLLS